MAQAGRNHPASARPTARRAAGRRRAFAVRVLARPRTCLLEAFLVSTVLVAIAEIGDKTQLLAILLAARFRKPWPILAGILAATLANHALAATAGYFVSGLLQGTWFRIAVGAAFI